MSHGRRVPDAVIDAVGMEGTPRAAVCGRIALSGFEIGPMPLARRASRSVRTAVIVSGLACTAASAISRWRVVTAG